MVVAVKMVAHEALALAIKVRARPMIFEPWGESSGQSGYSRVGFSTMEPRQFAE
jgi:hypothetical protein